jgi:hypothetical protein
VLQVVGHAKPDVVAVTCCRSGSRATMRGSHIGPYTVHAKDETSWITMAVFLIQEEDCGMKCLCLESISSCPLRPLESSSMAWS